MNPLAEIPLLGVPETGAVPETRLKDVASAREIFTKLKDADDINSQNRARMQSMVDGDPPYDQAKLNASGQKNRTNVNFGEAEKYLEYAMSGYIDLVYAPENLVSVRTQFGTPEEQAEWNEILAEELTRLFRESWTQFHFNCQYLAHQFVLYGLGVAYFPDASDWRFRATGLGEFYFPRMTYATEDDLEVAAARRGLPIWHLYRKIEKEEDATRRGWNVPMVRKALARACSKDHDADDWEKLAVELKNNDLNVTAKHAEVKLVHLWVREFNNSITHYIFTEEALAKKEEDDFLYKKNNAFSSFTEAFVMFPFGLGTNAHTHGIRGLGHKIYPLVQLSNRLHSQFIDGAMLASSLTLETTSEEALSELALAYWGPYSMLAPGVTPAKVPTPNFANSVMPALGEMGRRMEERVGAYTTRSATQGGGERRTRFEVAAELEQAAKLSSTSLELFYAPFERLLRESVKRVTRRNFQPVEPGGKEVAALRLRLVQRGVPLEALHRLDHLSTRAVRAVGAGSAAARSMALAELTELAGSFDDIGRYNLIRDRAVARVGIAQADRYVPRRPTPRLPADTKTAMLENEMIATGSVIPVLPEELHITHVEIHLTKLNALNEEFQSGTAPIEEVVPQMMPLFEHTAEHMQRVNGDATVVERAAMYRQNLQQLGETISNGVKRLQKMEREAAQQAEVEGAAPEPAAPAIDVDAISRLERHRAELQYRQERHEQEMLFRQQKAAQERAIQDAKDASQLSKLLR